MFFICPFPRKSDKTRLVGIDAPETAKGKRKPDQPFSQRAKKHLAKMVLNKVVDFKGYGLGPYNRVLGIITSEARNFNLEMVKAGLAVKSEVCEVEVKLKS